MAYDEGLAARVRGLLGEVHTAPVEMRGGTMTGWLLVAPAGLADDAGLARWVEVGAARVRALRPAT